MNKLVKYLFLILIISSSSLASANSLEQLIFVTESYPPYQFYDQENKLTGISIDILKDMMNKQGIEEDKAQEIKVYDWHKAYKLAMHPKLQVCLFATVRTTEREKLFQWVGPLLPMELSLYAKPYNEHKKANDFYPILVIRNDISHRFALNDLSRASDSLYVTDNFNSAMKLFHHDKYEALMYGSISTMWQLNSLGYTKNNIAVIDKFIAGSNYFAFSHAVPKNLIKSFQESLDKLIAADPNYIDNMVNKYIN